jgi:hypothetical protein
MIIKILEKKRKKTKTNEKKRRIKVKLKNGQSFVLYINNMFLATTTITKRSKCVFPERIHCTSTFEHGISQLFMLPSKKHLPVLPLPKKHKHAHTHTPHTHTTNFNLRFFFYKLNIYKVVSNHQKKNERKKKIILTTKFKNMRKQKSTKKKSFI